MTILKYHQKSLELISYQTEFNSEAYPYLPPSVSEWFSLTKGVEILTKYSNQDVPVSPDKFQPSKFKDKNLSIFMYENQRVVCWAFENSHNEDPPVYINYDPPENNFSEEVASEEYCFVIQEKFSSFVYKWIFDHFHWYEEDLFLIRSLAKPIHSEALELLNREFTKEPFDFSNSGEIIVYRFSKNDQKILITNGKEKFQWQFSADTNESVNNLYEKFNYLF